MRDRRDVLTLAASASLAALGGAPVAWAAMGAAMGAAPRPTLQTRLFNFREDVSRETIEAIVAELKAFNNAPGVEGVLIGQNIIPTPFPTRFEWLYMVQPDAAPAEGGADAFAAFTRAAEALSRLCRNEAQCDLGSALPARFAAAPGVKVRHTVMFDFKPDASAEARERNVAAIRGMGKLPMVQHYVVQRTLAAALGPTAMEWQVIGDFASLDDYKAYSSAPVHLAIRDDFTAHTARVAFLDVAV